MRRIDVAFKVSERIPQLIDEITRIRGVELYVEVRTREENIATGLPNEPINLCTEYYLTKNILLPIFECVVKNQ